MLHCFVIVSKTDLDHLTADQAAVPSPLCYVKSPHAASPSPPPPHPSPPLRRILFVSRARPRAEASMEQGGAQGRRRRRRGRGRQEPPPHDPHPVPLPGIVQVAEEQNPDAAEVPVVNFDVPEELLNQNEEVDNANRDLSQKYLDMHNLRNSISDLCALVVRDEKGHNKQIEVCVEEYKNLRKSGEELRELIRRMVPPGRPFEEPEGLDIMP